MPEFTAESKVAEKLNVGESLAHMDTGTRMQVREGKTSQMDGPFTDVKEMIGGAAEF